MGQLRTVIQHLRRLAYRGEAGGLTDTELLARFVTHRDQAAFELLAWRHGSMVLGVCQRVLGHEQDAEDAFQATFLAFVRQAGSIGKRESVGSWLYKVAYRAALRARAAARKRARKEKRTEAREASDPSQETAWREVQLVIDEEIDRLPEKYRVPFVLCHLEGKTLEEAARQLGCPRGTVGTRVRWARERLRRQLAQRGLALSAAALSTLVLGNVASACVSTALVVPAFVRAVAPDRVNAGTTISTRRIHPSPPATPWPGCDSARICCQATIEASGPIFLPGRATEAGAQGLS